MAGFDNGEIAVPPPPESVKDLPFVGEQIHSFWQLASTNLRSALTQDPAAAQARRRISARHGPKRRRRHAQIPRLRPAFGLSSRRRAANARGGARAVAAHRSVERREIRRSRRRDDQRGLARRHGPVADAGGRSAAPACIWPTCRRREPADDRHSRARHRSDRPADRRRAGHLLGLDDALDDRAGAGADGLHAHASITWTMC